MHAWMDGDLDGLLVLLDRETVHAQPVAPQHKHRRACRRYKNNCMDKLDATVHLHVSAKYPTQEVL